MKERIIIFKSRKKAWIIILAGFLLSGISMLWFVYANDDFLGWVLLISAALVLVLGIGNFSDKKPQIVVTETGITEPYAIKEEIEWDAILQVDEFFFRGQGIVRLLLPLHYQRALPSHSWFWRLNRIYEKQGFKAMYIRTNGLEINSVQLTALIDNIIKRKPEQREECLRSLKESLGKAGFRRIRISSGR